MAAPMTHEEYIAKATEKHNGKYDYSITKYKSAREDIEYICPIHGKQSQNAAAHLKSNGCLKCGLENRKQPKRYTKEKFLQKSQEQHGNRYDYSQVNYIDQETPVTIICPEHGPFEQKPVKHVNGSKCPKCRPEKNIKWTQELLINEAKKRYGNNYDYSETVYKTMKTPTTFKCNKHHTTFTQIPKLFLKRPSCPFCIQERKKLTTEQYIEKAKKVHGNKYDYSITNYQGMDKPIEYICPIHGKVTQRADGHLNYGCDACAHLSRRKDTEEYIAKAKKLHGNKYLYDKTVYVTADKKVTVTCPEHGDFKITAREHIRQSTDGKRGPSGCPICASSKAEQEMYNFLKKHNVEFIKEYKIPGYNYRYDFYLPKYNVLVELDGQQHFEPVTAWGGYGNLEVTKRNDRIKNALAKEKGYSLIRIKYTEFDNLIPYFKMRMNKLFKFRWKGNYFKTFKEICDYYQVPGETTPRNIYQVLKDLNK